MDFSRRGWKDGVEMEVFPQRAAGGSEHPSPRADGAAEPGEHVLHERGAAVPLQPHPTRAVFPLGWVELSPTRVSWFVHTTLEFSACHCFPSKGYVLPWECPRHLPAPPGSSSHIGHQLVSFSFDSPLFHGWVVQHDTILPFWWQYPLLLSQWWFLPLSGICRVPQAKWQLPELHCTCVWVSVLCSHLKADTMFSNFTWTSPLFSKGDWRGCDCLWLFDVGYVAWRVWVCFPWGFSFRLWEAVPSFQQEDSARCTRVPHLCAGWPPRGFQGGESPAVVFWELQVFVSSAFHDLEFHVIIAYRPLLNSMMGPLITCYLYFISMYTQSLICFLSNAPSNCSPNPNDNAGVASLS